MSSMYITGIKPPDEKWMKMKAIYDSCNDAGVEAPEEVMDFFADEAPDSKGVLVPLATQYDGDLDEHHECVEKWDAPEMTYGMELDLSKLPKDIKVLRFSYVY